MDEILDEIGLSYNELYKLHTRHNLNRDSEESDNASISSGSLDEHIKPPLYTYEEICDNLIVIEPQSSAAISENTSSTITSEEIANKLRSCLTGGYCFICKKYALGHYKSSRHYNAIRKWIQNQLGNSLMTINMKDIFCEICNLALSGNQSAQEHYYSALHKKKAKSFCLLCLRQVDENKMPTHLLSKKHIKNQAELPEMGQANLNEHKDQLKEYKAPKTNEIKVTNLKPICSNDNGRDTCSTKTELGSIIAGELKTLLTPTCCNLCEMTADISIMNIHYSGKNHTLALRNWLNRRIQKNEVAFHNNVIYCEDCLLVLGGTKKDLNHYDTISHKMKRNTYCSICIVRGTEIAVQQHLGSKKHKKKLKEFMKNDDQKESPYESWPKNLRHLITLHKCKLCLVDLETTDKASFHYNSNSHNTKVRNWIEHFYQFGDKDSTENSKKLPCTFCSSKFSSEQELKDHQDIHFPSLGSVVGNAPYKKSRNIKTKTTLQTFENEKATSDVKDNYSSISTFQERNDCIKERDDHSNKSKLNLTLERSVEQDEYRKISEDIKREIIKLFKSIYVLKTLPLNQSLPILKQLNKKLLDASRKYRDPNKISSRTSTKNNGDIEKMVLSNPIATSNDIQALTPNNDCDIINEGTRRKLSMEVQRLRMVISNRNKIPVDMASTYVDIFNQILEASMIGRPCEFNIKDIFKTNNTLPLTSDPEKKLLDGLDKLNNILFDSRNKNEERALDLITQFNVHLEKYLQRQAKKTYSFLSF